MESQELVEQPTTIGDMTTELLISSEEGAREYLRQWWISGAISTLRETRWNAGLTQRDVAERLGIDQASVTRIERDDVGKTSIARFIDYAMACGVVPFDVQVLPFEKMRVFAIHNPGKERTATSYGQLVQQLAFSNNSLVYAPTKPLQQTPQGAIGTATEVQPEQTITAA